MNKHLLKLFYGLPGPLRTAVASLRGYYLRRWRYGSQTDALVDEYLMRESWTAEDWRYWQEERLAHVLHRAATRVPFYRVQWAERRRSGDQASWEYLENWPILEKESLRASPELFVSDDCDLSSMYRDHTSGTTGTPLTIWSSRRTIREWYALFEARGRRWYDVSRHDRWAILGGQLIVPAKRTNPPFWIWNHAFNQLYMSSYHLTPENAFHYVDALRQYTVEYILAYTSSIYALAQLIKHKRPKLNLQVIITNAEPIFDYQRSLIEEVFECPVRETYGMAEMVAAASECEYGHLHLWPEVGLIEIFQDLDSMPGVSDIIATGLLNADMPLIRYRVGDRGALRMPSFRCKCGRNLPILKQLEGRKDDIIYTQDGRQIGRLDPVFKADLPIREAQIIQKTLNSFVVKYVPDTKLTSDAEATIASFLIERVGEVNITFEKLDKIPVAANGKFRAVISELTPDDIASVVHDD